MSAKLKINKNKQIQEILKRNAGSDILESDSFFVKSFLSCLMNEQEGELPIEKQNPADFTPEKNKGDFEQSLDPQTNKQQFDVEGISTEVHIENIKKIKNFSDKLDEFASFLNDPSGTESLHKILSDNDKPGSLLRGITRKTSDGITRVAGEIEKLKEVLNSFIILAPKKLRDTEQVSVAG